MKPARPAPKRDTTYEWLIPGGVLGLVAALASRFVGHNPFGLENDRTAQVVEMGLALGAFGILAWGYWLKTQDREHEHQVLRDRTLVAIGLCAFFGYFNFGHLHFNNFVHIWDTYHYYMGAKYFPENGYERMYDCAMVADSESGRIDQVKRMTITDLRNNVIVKTDDVLAHPDEHCKKHFTPERWAQYKADINLFRSQVGERRWQEIHHDHGYNATPVWTLAGMALTNTAKATLGQVTALNLLDPLYLALTALIIWWAFGPRAFALALLILGTNFPNRYYWTGGAFLRHDWLFYLVATIALLKKEKFALAGGALAYTTLLRLFPGLIAIGPALGALAYWRLHKKLDPRFLRFVAGGAVGTVVLLGLSFVAVGGPSTWQQFAQNTVKHANTPLTNHMGLRTVLSYRPDTVGQRTLVQGAIDPWAHWKETRLEKWHEAQPLFFLLLAGAMVLVYFALKNAGADPWMGAAMGVGFIVLGAELTCYYYCFMMGLAALHEKRREVGLLLAGMCATTLFLEWHPLRNMSGWLDEQYVTMTMAEIIAIVAIWWAFTKSGEKSCIPPEPSPDLALAGGGVLASGGGGSSGSDGAGGKKHKDKKKKKR